MWIYTFSATNRLGCQFLQQDVKPSIFHFNQSAFSQCGYQLNRLMEDGVRIVA